MNIGIIHGFVGGGGGTEKTLYAILDALEKTDHNVTLYTFSKPKIKSQRIKIKTTLPLSIPAFGLYQRAMESKLISKAKDEDMLIQASGGLGIPEKPGQKIIIYCHGDFSSELENPSTKYKGILSLYYKSYQKMIKKFVDNISNPKIILASNSEFVCNSIKSKHGKDSQVIYPPVNIDEFEPQKKENKVISIGRFSEEKNFEFGIDVMSKLDFPYYIIGNTKTKSNILYFERLESKTKKLGSIKLLKNIQRDELVDQLNRSKIYLHCSRETFGISVVEAIAAGCIPIVPDNSAHKETVPFEQLRYRENDVDDALEKINHAVSGKYDKLLPLLYDNAKKFQTVEFQKNMLKIIES